MTAANAPGWGRRARPEAGSIVLLVGGLVAYYWLGTSPMAVRAGAVVAGLVLAVGCVVHPWAGAALGMVVVWWSRTRGAPKVGGQRASGSPAVWRGDAGGTSTALHPGPGCVWAPSLTWQSPSH